MKTILGDFILASKNYSKILILECRIYETVTEIKRFKVINKNIGDMKIWFGPVEPQGKKYP